MHLQHHQIPQVFVQGDEEGEAFVAGDAFSAGEDEDRRRDGLGTVPQWARMVLL